MATEILIFGAGAIGAFYGSRLAQNKDVQVSCICRSNYNAVRSRGFSITSPQYGNYKWTPTRTFASPDEARKAQVKWDFVVVSTKALPDVTDDSKLLEGLVPDGSAIVLIQNGLGVEAPYASRFPTASILSAVTIASCAQPEHGLIKHNRWTRINIGPFLSASSSSSTNQQQLQQHHPRPTQQTETFVQFLKDAGVRDASSYSHAKMQLLRWHKIAINAAMNPSSVLSGVTPNSAMALDPDLSSHLKGVMEEVLATAPKVIGEPFPKDFATAEQILKSTQNNTSGSLPSMAIDWMAGKAMEIEVILGNPVRLARENGLCMPRTETLYALIKMLQKNRDEKQGQFKKASNENNPKL